MSSNDENLRVTHHITLDCSIPRLQHVCCLQNDKSSRAIVITVTNNGEPITLDADTMKVNCKIRKPDDIYIYNTTTINDDGTVSIVLTEQATTTAGICYCELQIIQNDAILSTMSFHIIVEKSVLNNEDIASDYESDVINNIISHLASSNNPHTVTKAQIGLENADNTSDNEKPVSALQQAALDLKADITFVQNAIQASAYTHPQTSGNKHIPAGGSNGQILRWSADGTASWESPSDSSSNGTFSSTSTKLITERDAYYGTPNFNGGKKSNSTTLYAPTYAGTSGYLLRSNGSGAPSWVSPDTVITSSKGTYKIIDGICCLGSTSGSIKITIPENFLYDATNSGGITYGATATGTNLTSPLFIGKFVHIRFSLVYGGNSYVETIMLSVPTDSDSCGAYGDTGYIYYPRYGSSTQTSDYLTFTLDTNGIVTIKGSSSIALYTLELI